jgi:hypothetical protein
MLSSLLASVHTSIKGKRKVTNSYLAIRLPYFLYNRLTDGGQAALPAGRPLPPERFLVLIYVETESTPGS